MPSTRLALVAVVAMAVAGCTGAPPEPEPQPGPTITEYVTGVQVTGREASTEVRSEALPAGGAGGPALTARSETTIVNGGSLLEPLTASEPFQRLRIALEPIPPTSPAVSGAGPAPGYYELTLTQATAEAHLVLTMAQALPGTSLLLHYAAVGADGTQGAPVRERVGVLTVGTGQVQVTVSWDADSDVDLHVLDPNSDEVYYEQPVVDSGGQLDLDSNAECTIDHKRNENITWPSAPPGPYLVRVDHWSNCGVERTRYVVTIRVDGQPAKVFHGEFTGPGDDGGLGAGREITTFTVRGPTPTG
jgi:hypothetical protein